MKILYRKRMDRWIEVNWIIPLSRNNNSNLLALRRIDDRNFIHFIYILYTADNYI